MEKNNCNKDCNYRTYVLKLIQRKILLVCFENEGYGAPKTIIKELENKLKISYRTANYNVNELAKLGYLELTKDGNIIFISLTDKAKEYLKYVLGNSQINAKYVPTFLDRAHRITLKCPLIQRPDHLDNGFKIVEGSKLNWKKDQATKRIDKYTTVQITPKNINFHFTGIYGTDPDCIVLNCINKAYLVLRTSIGSNVKTNWPNIAIVEQHHALSNKDLAKFTRHYNIHYKSDRLVFDKSIASGEFELVHPQHAQGDFIRLTDVLEAIIRGDITLDNLKEIKSLIPQIKALLENLQKDKQKEQSNDGNVNGSSKEV